MCIKCAKEIRTSAAILKKKAFTLGPFGRGRWDCLTWMSLRRQFGELFLTRSLRRQFGELFLTRSPGLLEDNLVNFPSPGHLVVS